MILSKDKQGNWTPTAGGTGTFIGTLAAFNAIKDTLPVNTVAYITDDGNGDLQPVDAVTNGDMHPVTSNAVYDKLNEFSPRSTGSLRLASETGSLAESESSATEYTAPENGLVIAHIVKNDSGNTCMLSVNGALVDSFPYYSPTTYATDAGMTEFTLTAFVRIGDKIKVWCDGNGNKYSLCKLGLQTISWYK